MRLFFSLLLLFAGSIKAQIRIKCIIENSNKVTIPNATVVLSSAKAAFSKSFISDSLGRLDFTNLDSGDYKLFVSSSGYEKKEIYLTISRDSNLNIQLVEITDTLKKVEITASKSLIERFPDRVVFNVDKSITSTGGDVLDLIKTMPGVQVTDNAISIVGKSTVRVMIDDQIVNLSGDDLFSYLKTFPASQVSKLELLLSPPAKYDPDGSSGLINIKTKHVIKQGLYSNLMFSYNQSYYALCRASASLAYNTKNYNLDFNFSGQYGDQRPTDQNILAINSQYWNLNNIRHDHTINNNFQFSMDRKVNKNSTISFKVIVGLNNPDRNEYNYNQIFNAETNKLDSLLITILRSI